MGLYKLNMHGHQQECGGGGLVYLPTPDFKTTNLKEIYQILTVKNKIVFKSRIIFVLIQGATNNPRGMCKIFSNGLNSKYVGKVSGSPQETILRALVHTYNVRIPQHSDKYK
jgi:hypothetical protein